MGGSTAPRCANSGGIDDSQDRVRRGSSFRRGSANDRSSHRDACSADEGSSRAQELFGLCSSKTKTPAEQATRKTRLRKKTVAPPAARRFAQRRSECGEGEDRRQSSGEECREWRSDGEASEQATRKT